MNTLADFRQVSAVAPSLPRWLRSLWAEVLFPGNAAPAHAVRWSALAVLVIVPEILLYPCLGFHLFEPDEGRYAQIPRELWERGEWVVPLLQGEPYLDKPPLAYWLIMLSYSLFGAADWSARLVPGLATHACILATYLLGRRSLGERSAFWGAILLALAPGFVSVGRLLVLDGLLALWVTVSVLTAFEAIRGPSLRWHWWLLSATACGLGILTKGPIAAVLLVVPVAAYSWLQNGGPPWSRRALAAFAGVVLAIVLPWYVAICMRLPDFGREFFWKHHVLRFLSPFDHLEPVWFYLPILFGGLLPGSLLVLAVARHLLTADPTVAATRRPSVGFMLLASGWCVLFFSLSGCKLPTYILPALPFLALVLGDFLVQTGRTCSLFTRAGLAVMFVILIVGHSLVLPWYAEFRSPFGQEAMVRAVCGDPATPVVCYPRPCDSVAFYVGRADFRQFRSKETPALIEFCKQQPRTVILFTHRHSLQALQHVLPPDELELVEPRPLFDSARAGMAGWKHLFDRSPLGTKTRDDTAGLCYLAVVQRKEKP